MIASIRPPHFNISRRSLRPRQSGIMLTMLAFALVLLVGCGQSPATQTPTATPYPSPTATLFPSPTATPTPSPTATPFPSPTPTRPPSPTRTPTPTSACVPAPGVQPVSSTEVDRGNTSRPQIALTFDAGGPATPTAQILDILARHDLHVTWFITGDWAQDNPDLVRRVQSNGHEIGNHTMTHADLTTLPNERVCQELLQADRVLSGITGRTTRPYFRPPNGARNATVRALAANLGYRTVYWTIDTIDWREDATPQSITDRVMNNLGNGVIVLMHAGSTVEAQTLDGLITKIEQRGYQIVSLSQLLK